MYVIVLSHVPVFKFILLISKQRKVHTLLPKESVSKKKGQFFYRRIGIESTQNYNASGVEISTNFKEQQQSQQKTAANYSNTLETDIPESNQKNPDEFNGLGKYFLANNMK